MSVSLIAARDLGCTARTSADFMPGSDSAEGGWDCAEEASLTSHSVIGLRLGIPVIVRNRRQK